MKLEDLPTLLTPEALPYLSGVERLMVHLARTAFGRALAVHCHEEMSTLAGFLPGLYASES